MQNITNYETKEIECDRCGWVGTVAKHIPLKQAWCGGCRSSRIRLHKRLLTKRAPDAPKAGAKIKHQKDKAVKGRARR